MMQFRCTYHWQGHASHTFWDWHGCTCQSDQHTATAKLVHRGINDEEQKVSEGLEVKSSICEHHAVSQGQKLRNGVGSFSAAGIDTP